jgi:hypothetical protein
MVGSSAAATRSCSLELGLTRRPCRGLLEAALEHVAAFHEIRRRRDSPSRPRSRAPARPDGHGGDNQLVRPGLPAAEENAGRAPCEATTGLPGPRIDVTKWPAQRRSHSGTLAGISAPRGVPRSPAGNQHATTAPAQHSQAAYPVPPPAKINIPTAIKSCPTRVTGAGVPRAGRDAGRLSQDVVVAVGDLARLGD